MTITIYEGYDNSYVLLGSKDPRFSEAWGSVVKVPVSQIYRNLAEITSWGNNKLDEEIIFEID